MSSQRAFDADIILENLRTSEDLIIDDEAENYFLCLAVWRHRGGLCRLQKIFMSR